MHSNFCLNLFSYLCACPNYRDICSTASAWGSRSSFAVSCTLTKDQSSPIANTYAEGGGVRCPCLKISAYVCACPYVHSDFFALACE